MTREMARKNEGLDGADFLGRIQTRMLVENIPHIDLIHLHLRITIQH